MISVLAIFLALPVFAQDEEETVTLPDAVMEQVVKRIVTWNFKPRGRPTKIRISAEGIKEEWLPKIENIQFVYVQDGLEGNDVEMWWFYPVFKEGRYFTIGFGYGRPTCSIDGDLWYFRVTENRVRLRSGPSRFGAGNSCHHKEPDS